MKLTKLFLATFALLSIATPSYAQGVLGTIEQMVLNGSRQQRTALPPTNLDSFVYQAGGMADQIYGDEGDIDIPPIDNFTKGNRIDAGIMGVNRAGLTTGHGSLMPDAWGADEFLMAPGEWDVVGTPPNNSQSNILNLGQLLQNGSNALTRGTTYSRSNVTSGANVNGTPFATPYAGAITPPAPTPPPANVPTPPVTPPVPPVVPVITFMTNPPAWVVAFGNWATQSVPYALTQGMVPVQDSTNGQLMGWMAPGQSLSQFLSGQTGLLLPGEQGQAQVMLQNLSPGNDYVVPGG